MSEGNEEYSFGYPFLDIQPTKTRTCIQPQRQKLQHCKCHVLGQFRAAVYDFLFEQGRLEAESETLNSGARTKCRNSLLPSLASRTLVLGFGVPYFNIFFLKEPL